MKKFLLTLLFLFTLIGCSLVSDYSLPNDQKININLIGRWEVYNSPNEGFIVEGHTDKSYKIKIIDDTIVNEFDAHTTTINGINFINVSAEDKNSIFVYEIENDTLRYYEINSELFNDKIKSQKHLIRQLKRKMNRKDFLINETILIRK